MRSGAGTVLAFVAILAVVGPAIAADPPSSCVACHLQLGDDHLAIVEGVEEGVHAAVEIGCHGCHGGNPDPGLADDMDAAMDPAYGPAPYVGVPERSEIPGACGSCHSDPSFMRRFQPDPRVDQLAEYRTSRHGERLAAGDPKVATCVSCHGVHGILGPSAPRSPVYPSQVAETCDRCHGDAEYMADYDIPIDQYARWRQSVHAVGLLEKEDLSAPTCNDCHGNHGALPPGIGSIVFICGQCHGREAELFRGSTKAAGFELHREMGAGGTECSDCHSEGPPAVLGTTSSFAECTTCHGNHGVIRPTVAMLSPLPETPCAFCHRADERGATGRALAIREHYRRVRESLLIRADARDLEGADRFDYLVEQALELPFHHRGSGGHEASDGELHPEFRRLFEKFRIGTAGYRYRDPASGEIVRATVATCGDCHAPEAELTAEPVGWQTAVSFLEGMQQLTSRTAEAERLLLAAERGGVATAGVRTAIDRAVDSQIQLEVLVHTFRAGEGSEFAETLEEGMEAAEAAGSGARQALDELSFRRRGLFVFLGLVVLVLVGLALKIRSLGS